MVLEDGPPPLYCSEECRRIDQEGAVFDVDRSVPDKSPRSIHDIKVDLPWSRPGLPTVRPPLPRNTSMPAFLTTATTHPFMPLPPPPKPSEKELWQRRVHEAFVNGQKYKSEPWLNPEFQATIQRRPTPRALEINDVLHAPGRTSRPSSYVGTVAFGPNEEVRTSLGGEDGFRSWYYGEEARSLPATYGMRRERPPSATDKKPKAELSFARQPSATNIAVAGVGASFSRPPSIKSRSNSNSNSHSHSRSRSRVRSHQTMQSLHLSAAASPTDDDNNGRGEPWWVADERRDYSAYMDALAAEDHGGPAAGPLEDWLRMRETRRRARFAREEKVERRKSLTAVLSRTDSNTPLLMRRLSNSRTAIHQHQLQAHSRTHSQAQAHSRPATRPPSPPGASPETTTTEHHISLNDPSPPYRISMHPRRLSLLTPCVRKDPAVQPQPPRRFSRGAAASGAASPRSPLGLHTISRQSLEDVTVTPPPPIDFSALKFDDTALAPVIAPAPAPAPAPELGEVAPTPVPDAPAPAPTASTSLPEKKPPPRSPTSPTSPTSPKAPRCTRPARPRGLSAISYLRPLEPIVLPSMAKAVPTSVAALLSDHSPHEPGHASGSGSDSSGTLVSYGSGSTTTRVGCDGSHEGPPHPNPLKHHSALDVGKMSRVEEVREDVELSRSPAEQSLSRAFAAAGHPPHPPHPHQQQQKRSRSPGALFARPMSLVWSSGQDVQRLPHSQGRVDDNASRRHSLWDLFGSVRS